MIAVIDYGVGNLFSLLSSLNYVGLDTKLTNDVKEIKSAKGIILPGVGAFRDAVSNLEKYGLKDILIDEAKNGKPFLGICLGMQMACVEFARNVLGYKDATSTEFEKDTSYPIISLMEEQKGLKDMGGTMRLGAYPCILKDDSLAARVYGRTEIAERHRHRYEFNNAYREEFEKAGMDIVGLSPDGNYVEVIEIKNHLYFIASQYHPEFKSRPNRPHPLFTGWIKAVLKKRNEK